MIISKRQRNKIKRTLPKNFRELIAKKCRENGRFVTPRQVSMVLDNLSKNEDLIAAVLLAATDLIQEKKKKSEALKEVIFFS